jgi:hypothetical protein
MLSGNDVPIYTPDRVEQDRTTRQKCVFPAQSSLVLLFYKVTEIEDLVVDWDFVSSYVSICPLNSSNLS